MDTEQFHRGDHCANPKHERDDLDDPKAQVAIQNREQRNVKNRHQRADDEELPV